MAEPTNETDTVDLADVMHLAEPVLESGRVVSDRYVIRGPLGKGGSSTVYRAHDRELGLDIALKVLRPEASTANVSRLRREVGLSRRVTSPAVVRINDIGADGPLAYLTMELVEGESLRECLKRGPLAIEEGVRIARGILDGVCALHTANVLHRDIKPENVLLSGEAVKVADFGLVRSLAESGATVTGAVVGTLLYVPPEQFSGESVDARTDLYAVGLVMFEMLAGRTPFAATSSVGAALKRLHARAPDVRTYRSAVPSWLAHVVGRLLERDPDARYTSAEAVIAALDARSESAPPSVKRRLRIAIVIAILLVAMVLGGMVWSSRRADLQFSHLVAPSSGGIAAISAGGTTLWERRDVDPAAASRWALVRRTPHGTPEIAVVLNARNDFALDRVRRLSFVDPGTGRITRIVTLPGSIRPFPRSPARFYPGTIRTTDLNRDGVDEIVTWFGHVPEWASFVVIYDPRTDRSRVVFIGYGQHGIGGLFDLDGDGKDELILFGHNNGLGWYNVIAALRLDVPFSREPDSSPDFPNTAFTKSALLWYALLPRGYHTDAKDAISFDSQRRLFTLRYLGGEIHYVTAEGFLPSDRSPVAAGDRQTARFLAYGHLREGRRLSQAGAHDKAIEQLDMAVTAARRSVDAVLVEAMRTERGEILAAAGRSVEAENFFREIVSTAYYPAETAYDAARAFHLAGDLDRALAWYRQGFTLRAAAESGKSFHEFLQGMVFVHAERHDWRAGAIEIERYRRTFGNPPTDWTGMYREFLNWRSGRLPTIANFEIPPNATDLLRYWMLEFRHIRGDAPSSVLADVEREIAAGPSETQSAMWSLRAELLALSGRTQEAQDAIQQAVTLLADDIAFTPIARVHAETVRSRAARLGG